METSYKPYLGELVLYGTLNTQPFSCRVATVIEKSWNFGAEISWQPCHVTSSWWNTWWYSGWWIMSTARFNKITKRKRYIPDCLNRIINIHKANFLFISGTRGSKGEARNPRNDVENQPDRCAERCRPDQETGRFWLKAFEISMRWVLTARIHSSVSVSNLTFPWLCSLNGQQFKTWIHACWLDSHFKC